jgi:hypothetical protein
VRTHRGDLVKAKDPQETADIARRILTMNVDVLAVQEVENIHILRELNAEHLGNLYRYEVLLEGNDPRFIDVGLLSKLPVGAVTSHQTAEHEETPGVRIFGRDLLEAEILHPTRTRHALQQPPEEPLRAPRPRPGAGRAQGRRAPSPPGGGDLAHRRLP